MTTVYITKYALTEGIMECEMIDQEGTMVAVVHEGGLNGRAFFHGNDWHMTKAAAVDRAEAMRKAKLKALDKQIAKLERMEF